MKHIIAIEILRRAIDEGYDKKAWHGPNLRGSLRGLSAKEAAWRFASNRHNIWEIVIHCAYWKYVVRRRILAEKSGLFPLKGSNWFHCPDEVSESAWREDIHLLEMTHRCLCDAIGGLRSADLKIIPRGSKVDNRAIISGIAMHDVYHAGQIQLLIRMMGERLRK